jgi:hypothetical protein
MLLLLNVASKQQTSIPYICLCKDLGSNPRVTEHEAHAMKKIYNYKTIICTYFYLKFISHIDKLMVIREANLRLIYVICVSLRIVVSNTYCAVLLLCFSSFCVPYVASFSGFSIGDYPSVFSNFNYLPSYILIIWISNLSTFTWWRLSLKTNIYISTSSFLENFFLA